MMILQKKAKNGGKQKIFSSMQAQQPQQPILVSGPQIPTQQPSAYLRPTSVGNVGGVASSGKKRDKSKLVVQEFIMNSNGVKPVKHSIVVPQSHNVSVS